MAGLEQELIGFEGFEDDEWMDELVEEVSITFCNENCVEVAVEPSLSTRKREVRKKDKSTEKTKKHESKSTHSEKGNHHPITLEEITTLVKDTLYSMETDDMIYEMYHSQIEKLKALDNYPIQELSKFAETCKGISTTSPISAKTKEAMWVKFNGLWVDGALTESLKKSFDITKDFCSWFLLTFQQTIAKRAFVERKPVVIATDLSADEQHTVTYISGSILKKLTTKLFDAKRKTKVENHPWLQKQIDMIYECRDLDDCSTNPNNRLIKALSRGGLVYPKKQFVEIFLKVESIFRSSVSRTSSSINKEEIKAKCFEETCIYENFFKITEQIKATDDEKLKLLACCIYLYIKIRSFGHAKNTIEEYHTITQTEKKKKALRRDIKKKSDFKNDSLKK